MQISGSHHCSGRGVPTQPKCSTSQSQPALSACSQTPTSPLTFPQTEPLSLRVAGVWSLSAAGMFMDPGLHVRLSVQWCPGKQRAWHQGEWAWFPDLLSAGHYSSCLGVSSSQQGFHYQDSQGTSVPRSSSAVRSES